MARPKVRVQHFLVCGGAEVEGPVGPDNPYVLRGVRYPVGLAPGEEFPTTLPELGVYCRLFHTNAGAGRVEFGVDVVWLDAPGGEELTSHYPLLAAAFRAADVARDRVWKLLRVVLPGPGTYEVRLQSGRTGRTIAREFFAARSPP